MINQSTVVFIVGAGVAGLAVLALAHALYQPVYLGVRTDVDAAECLLSQLKYKAED